jgi:hypothetical protein
MSRWLKAFRPREGARVFAWTALVVGIVLYFRPAATVRFPYGALNSKNAAFEDCSAFQNIKHENSKQYVPDAPVGGDAAAMKARYELARLNRRTVGDNTTGLLELLRERRSAFETLIQSDQEVRRAWNTRLASAAPRGIVICAGGAQPLVNAFVSLYVQHTTLNSSLPVAVLHWGEAEVSSGTRLFFSVHLPCVRFIDMSNDYPKWHRPLGSARNIQEMGFQLKALALYVAPFREVIMLDSDATPLQPLAPLFDSPAVRHHGNLFWPDFWHTKPGIWDALKLHNDPWEHGIDPREPGWDGAAGLEDSRPDGQSGKVEPRLQRQAESGLVVLNRARYWRVLEWALFLSSHADSVYTLPGMLGDKDTFRAAFSLADAALEFRQSPYAPALPLVDRRAFGSFETPRYRYMGMVQLHPDGSALVHHRTWNTKFPAFSHDGELAGPITHVSAPASTAQGGLYHTQLGLLEQDVRVVTCGANGTCQSCSMWAIGALEEACGGRTDESKQHEAVPVLLAAIPRESYVWRALADASAAHDMLPFI